MAATRLGTTITFTADNDAVLGVYFVNGLTFAGTGLSAGSRLRVTDTAGNLVADYYTVSSTGIENADLWNGRQTQVCHGLKVEDAPAGAGWTLTVFLE
jgi:hypothetical protein